MKVLVEKENYELFQAGVKATGGKLNDLFAVVPDCIDGVWGAYRILRCYRSINNYYAEIELLERAENEMDAHYRVFKVVEERKKRGEKKC